MADRAGVGAPPRAGYGLCFLISEDATDTRHGSLGSPPPLTASHAGAGARAPARSRRGRHVGLARPPGAQRHHSLPLRLRDRRGARHGRGHRAWLGQRRHDRHLHRPRLRLRLRAHHAAHAARRPHARRRRLPRPRRGHRLDHDHGGRRQPRHAGHSRRDGGRSRLAALLGKPRDLPADRRRGGVPGQPLAHRSRPRARGGAPAPRPPLPAGHVAAGAALR